MIPELIAGARKIVFKFGSNTLANREGRINTALLEEFAGQAAACRGRGKEVVIVSSGAQVAGLSTIGAWARKRDLHYRQALCAVGQVELMDAWRRAFERWGVHIAQILLTGDDFADPLRTLNMRNTLFTLVDEGIVPVINENDTVSVEEIKIGDNDTLAARSAILWSADLLVLFSDIDGLYSRNPKEFPDARLISEVRDLGEAKRAVAAGPANEFGTGGIGTKLAAAERALGYGIPVILAHGGRPGVLEALAEGRQAGTVFLPGDFSPGRAAPAPEASATGPASEADARGRGATAAPGAGAAGHGVGPTPEAGAAGRGATAAPGASVAGHGVGPTPEAGAAGRSATPAPGAGAEARA